MGNPPRITWRGGQLRAIKSRHFKVYRHANATNAEIMAIAQARKDILDFILTYRQLRALSLRQAILIVHGRIRERKLPPHLVDAVFIANARPNRIGSITISVKTLFRWARAYRLADGDMLALAPTPSKARYANTNAPIYPT